MPFLLHKINNGIFVQTFSFLQSYRYKSGNRGEEGHEPCYFNKLAHQESLVMRPVRDINDSLSVLCFTVTHFDTHWFLNFQVGRLHKCQSYASPQETRNLATLRRKKIWDTRHAQKAPSPRTTLHQVVRTTFYRSRSNDKRASLPVQRRTSTLRVPLHHGSIYDNKVGPLLNPKPRKIWRLMRKKKKI